jgi:hypothetical protein
MLNTNKNTFTLFSDQTTPLATKQRQSYVSHLLVIVIRLFTFTNQNYILKEIRADYI